MIIGEKFVIAHIPRTGGDALKSYYRSLELPGSIYGDDDPEKHGIPSDYILENRDLILTIRRLPEREISFYEFHNSRDESPIAENRERPGEFLAERGEGESWIGPFTDYGRRVVSHLIRSEFLFDDLVEVMRLYHDIDPEAIRLGRFARTKPRGEYDREISRRFTKAELRRLYERSPIWSSLESRAYGDILSR